MSKKLKIYLIILFGIFIFPVLILTYSLNKDQEGMKEENPINSSLDTIQVPAQNSRILVVAPHNDDEAIAASQFITRSIMNGCTVKIIMVTNGDDFKRAFSSIWKLFRKPSFLDYIHFGYKRQNETIDAMESIGVKRSNIYFLGYPDGGIARLWWKNFYSVYTSQLTKASKSPYNDSYTKNVSYTGNNLAKDMQKIIGDFKPDYIVYPHPDDNHPDHKAVNFFVQYALAESGFKPTKELLYLVHRKEFPFPREYKPELYLAPPHSLMNKGTKWYSFSISEKEELQKLEVLQKYKSQYKYLEYLFKAVIRKNELFGIDPDLKLKKNMLKNDDGILPTNGNMLISDPVNDYISHFLSKKADIIGVYGEISANNNLNMFLETKGNIENKPTYHLYMVIFKGSAVSHIDVAVNNGSVVSNCLEGTAIKGVECSVKGHFIHLIIPNEIYTGYTSMLCSGKASMGRITVDITALKLIQP